MFPRFHSLLYQQRSHKLDTLFFLSCCLLESKHLQGYLWGSMITFVALVGSLMVSYVRDRGRGDAHVRENVHDYAHGRERDVRGRARQRFFPPRRSP